MYICTALAAAQSPYNPNWYSGSQPSSDGGWRMPPPPPPMMSGEVSGAFSSGPIEPPRPPPHPSVALGFGNNTFSYEELAAATEGFSQGNLLGQGGFGFVHKGVLPNGKEIAVKSLKSGSGQGEKEFQAEVEIISRVHHRHLVSLVGYCIADIKSANILIDNAFEAKVADFGLAKLTSDNFTHVSTRAMGTFGYLAPEYAASGKLTEKSDVFSFGVVLLELITGRRPVNPTGNEDSLVDWSRPRFSRALDEGKFEGLVDPRMETKFNSQEMTRMVACASASIRHSAKRRPRMSQMVRALEGDMSLDALNDGVRPGQSTSMGPNSHTYQHDMQNIRRALDTEKYSSSDYGTSTEYTQTGPRNFV
ncbi:hypothetical protein V2J09_016564 [Rumex salicifolius]